MIPRYTLPEMAAIWSETARFERMLEVELAVVRAQVARGQVPADALVAIEAGARGLLWKRGDLDRHSLHRCPARRVILHPHSCGRQPRCWR